MEVTYPKRVRLGVFELDLKAGELHSGTSTTTLLQQQPFQVLRMLVAHHGEVVLREEIQKRLWPNDTVVEFDHAINTAIKKLRQALGDSAEEPRYIETVARRGYRLIMPVEWADVNSAQPESSLVLPTESELPAANLTGRRVSHYRVLEVLGGGGMGVVYRAEDLKLGRRVALKFLPEELCRDEKALERFEREARAVSALDHPNICIIHEFGEHDGQPFIAMPLLEGRTLRDRFAEGTPWPMDVLLDVAIQIGRGLEAAHQKGIIHRDIKPANIFITGRGEAKIFDFGLAKLAEAEDQLTVVQRVTLPGTDLNLTRTGVTLGTAAYLSPEQVRGQKLDARTDLFSFGLVLYEMGAGQRAFTGETAPILREAILKHRPASARELNAELPCELEAVINKALEKEREYRYQSASQMISDLERLQRKRDLAGRGNRRLLSTAVLLGFLVLCIAMLWLANRRLSSHLSLPKLKQRQLTDNSSENAVTSGAISPDGKYLAYADLKGIHIKLLETGETRTVPEPEDLKGVQVNWGIVSTWVRDGTRFIANAIIPGHRSSIWMVATMGGAPRKIRDDAFAGSVSRDGALVAFATKPGRVYYSEMWLMKPDGTKARKLFEADEDSGFTGTEWSPDGQRLAYGRGHLVADQIEWSIESRDFKGGSPTTAIRPAGWDWSWLPDGRMIYSLNDPAPAGESCNFWIVRINPHTGKPVEETKPITNWAGFCMDDPSATANGKQLTFRKWSWEGGVYVAELKAKGTRMTPPRRLTLNEGRNYPAAWTTDNRTVVFRGYRDGHWKAFKQRLDEDTAEPIAAEFERDVIDAQVSPDGSWVLYTALRRNSDSSPQLELMRVPIKGGPPQSVLSAAAPTYRGLRCTRSPASFCLIAERSINGRHLTFTSVDPLKGRGDELVRSEIDNTAASTYVWDVSPDGSRIAILKYAEGRIHILSLRSHTSQEIVVEGWNNLQSVDWAADGRGLFVSSVTEARSALLSVDLRGRAHILWEQKGSIAPSGGPFDQPLGGPSAPWAVPSPDGRRLAIYVWSLNANIWMMENF